ncbi:TetR/AcrR family transcriptional regulator [Novosphingobium sp. KCTC 2891]|uniref:TetR/AcrR family transcriptional regulator n=1 Tax=Novosphingobium sp. KCTC 2891 TaxID=2989730 RepID=UPI002222924F|nr:TetR/AcrR family transcriptional regulator [Novosphingobium sp. KCTC 2891]
MANVVAKEGKGAKGAKGARTRAAILDAAIDCYNLYGYAKTTQEKIAERAGMSMGAVTYHFSSIAAITRAAITHAFALRLRKHEETIRAVVSIPQDFETALEIYWNEMIDPLFIACHELAVAARTDPILKAELVPAHERFQRQWNRNLLALHPEWGEAGEMFRFAVEYSTFLVEGMALNYLLIGGSEKRLQDLRDYMKDNLEAMLQAGLAGIRTRQLLAPGRSRRAKVARSPLGKVAKLDTDA